MKSRLVMAAMTAVWRATPAWANPFSSPIGTRGGPLATLFQPTSTSNLGTAQFEQVTFPEVTRVVNNRGVFDNAGLAPVVRITSPLDGAFIAPGDSRIGAGDPKGTGFVIVAEIVTRDDNNVTVDEDVNIRNVKDLFGLNPAEERRLAGRCEWQAGSRPDNVGQDRRLRHVPTAFLPPSNRNLTLVPSSLRAAHRTFECMERSRKIPGDLASSARDHLMKTPPAPRQPTLRGREGRNRIMNRRHLYRVLGFAAVCLAVQAQARAFAALRCPPDSVQVGDVCIDTYEASVWQIPAANTALIRRAQLGRATLADLTSAGATQVSPASTCSPAFPTSFDATGNWTSPLFAVSVAGVPPTSCVSWFQAEQACALSGKRLLTNQEWQRAAAGTPDPGTDDGGTDCNVGGLSRPLAAGSRAKCTSNWGVFDMVGNVEEWVADWVPQSTDCPGWGAFSDDRMCFAGASTTATGPGALVRGGSFINTTFAEAGVFALDARPTTTLGNSPEVARRSLGFRCAR